MGTSTGQGRSAGEYRVMKAGWERPFGYMLIMNLLNYIKLLNEYFAFKAGCICAACEGLMIVEPPVLFCRTVQRSP
ncbi:hypothetical protein NVV30_02425 [Pseudomonas syringae]|uniref:hypothetical protein n=1 Tax=Pseudomonas syringae TaxID=317 RepID=UPI00215A1ED6|nr:hypothetical protein [Pseudomonas syringae]MCR8717551.1 hypothetical protein [Pseudomonas syringae]